MIFVDKILNVFINYFINVDNIYLYNFMYDMLNVIKIKC